MGEITKEVKKDKTVLKFNPKASRVYITKVILSNPLPTDVLLHLIFNIEYESGENKNHKILLQLTPYDSSDKTHFEIPKKKGEISLSKVKKLEYHWAVIAGSMSSFSMNMVLTLK